ncbi:Cytochrome p450 family protein [Zalerion maritima]|uniref:Cytochrome p450 family protein n=1 Tax=Zalerion maritima TaxID=339359 RepID=A0AAD5RRV8_9PEZI|nr:Cytochrome p450 family protein [Zalerion maritima]
MDSARPSTTGFTTQFLTAASERLPSPVLGVLPRGPISIIALTLFLIAIVLCSLLLGKGRNGRNGRNGRRLEAPALPEIIPFVSNTVDYIRDLPSFCRDVSTYFSTNNLTISTFRLVFQKVHLVVGPHNTNALFQPRTSGLSEHQFTVMFVNAMADPPAEDLHQWQLDTSGKLRQPNPGTEHIVGHGRIFIQWANLLNTNLARPGMSLELAELYYARFLPRFRTVGHAHGVEGDQGWEELKIFSWLRKNMTTAAGTALGGTLFLQMFPEYFSIMNEFELAVLKICFGPPRWMNKAPYLARDKWLSMNEEVVKLALQKVPDFDKVEGEKWIPELGHSMMRQAVRWNWETRKMSLRTTAASFGALILDQNGNTAPSAAWAVMQVLTAPNSKCLISRLGAEAEEARKEDGRFDIQKLAAMPVFTAVFSEVLRLHTNFNITRIAQRDIVMSGYDVKKGSLVQAPTLIAHFDPVWDSHKYPKEEFWPDRMLRRGEDGKMHFDMTSGNRHQYWFPFGGGTIMCPGRIFAKQEICLALAMFLTEFRDIEAVRWEMHSEEGNEDGDGDGGEKSGERPAKDVEGFITMLPDRELRVRVRR